MTHDPSRYHFLHGVSPDGKTLAFAEFATYMSFPTGTLDHPADPRGRRATGPHVELDRADRAVLAVRRSGPVGIGFIGAGTVSDTRNARATLRSAKPRSVAGFSPGPG